MGVFKWLRRERMTVTTRHNTASDVSPEEQSAGNVTQIGTIRTQEYKRDLAEFQARRSGGPKDLQETPVKKKCGRHSLPVSCTDCATDHDNTFSYEKKSAIKYKQSKRRGRSATPEQSHERVPNIQFLFQNQVFMPGNVFATSSYSEPRRHQSRRQERSPDMDFLVQRHIDFKDDEEIISPPNFYKNSSLPFDVKNLVGSQSEADAVDGSDGAGDLKSSQSSNSPRKNDSGDDKLWEVMTELKRLDRWADEQLQERSPNVSKSDDSKSDTSAYGLPVASASDLDVASDGDRTWSHGKWGVVPVQVKKLAGVTSEHVRKKRNTEINILRKWRHPNIILLMGLYPDIHDDVHLICERCVDSLYGIIHEQGRILSAQSAVHYSMDIANALAFLRMQGYVHTGLNSTAIMVTSHDAAKLADFGACVKLNKARPKKDRGYHVYSPEPHYVNIEDSRQSNTADCQPLISENPSEAYITANAVTKPYKMYEHSDLYAWQAPELFVPDEDELVYPCSKSDVYSLCLVLWECCNAKMPFKNLTYDKLKEHYTLWKTGISLPQDGTYPGCLLSLLQHGLKLQRSERIDLDELQTILQNVKSDLDDIGYVIIPARLPNKKTSFSATNWDTTTPTDSDCLSPQNVEHKVVVHKTRDSSTESEKDCSKSSSSPIYESVLQSNTDSVYAVAEKCFVCEQDTLDDKQTMKYDLMPEKDYSSACSTPLAKIKARIQDMETPGSFHRSDSTEYCSILSPNRTNMLANDDSNKERSTERPTAKLSRSFTPKSYKPLHIKVPECNLEGIKPLLKESYNMDKPSYNFDIKNYSLPSTPIARSNKLRKNAWLSGDLSFPERCSEKIKHCILKSPEKNTECVNVQSAPETPVVSMDSSLDKTIFLKNSSPSQNGVTEVSPKSIDTVRDSYTGLKRVDPPHDFVSPEPGDGGRVRTSSWSFKSNTTDRTTSKYIEEEVLANVNVKPLVAIHEKWIYEANRKTGRSMSLPEDNRTHTTAVKPASHCVDTLQKSLPQLNIKKATTKIFRAHPPSPSSGRAGVNWDQFCQAREAIARNVNFFTRNTESSPTKMDDVIDKSTSMDETKIPSKIDQATDTRGIEEFIRVLIRKEFQNLVHEVSDDLSTVSSNRNEEMLNKGVANIMESLNNEDIEKTVKKEPVKSFSRVKINGNNKPLLQITFSRSGENSLHVIDKNCVNVTFCDSNGGRDKLNVSLEDTLTGDDGYVNSLKRCQAFSAIQEAKSTEDLYIDDDLSTHMQENFGGKVKLIPLHGSLHEILCEKEDDCCLIKVKQENGCDTIYFRCDNSDTESRDAIDSAHENLPQDTVVFKRSISLIEERIQRIVPKDKRAQTPIVPRKPRVDRELKIRPKSEIFIPIKRESRALSNSSPSLISQDDKEVEVNIENVLCYQDSSSDECLRCQEPDDFEMLERKIEQELANSSLNCGCLEKISEENLSSLAEDGTDKE